MSVSIGNEVFVEYNTLINSTIECYWTEWVSRFIFAYNKTSVWMSAFESNLSCMHFSYNNFKTKVVVCTLFREKKFLKSSYLRPCFFATDYEDKCYSTNVIIPAIKVSKYRGSKRFSIKNTSKDKKMWNAFSQNHLLWNK